jgi:RNA polymerase sigma-70 factor (ECF subfamily)
VPLFFDGDDTALVAAICSGDRRAMGALVDRYGRYIERLVAHLMGLDPHLYDFVQEVFVRAIRDMGRLEQPDRLKPWLRSIAVFTVRTELRRRQRWSFFGFRDPDELPDVAGPSADLEGQEALRRVDGLLARMPAEERLILCLRLFENMEQLQIATELAISLATVKRRLTKATSRFMTLAAGDPVLRHRVVSGGRSEQ